MSGLNKYAKYENMSTEALDKILRQDFLQTNDAELDVDAILHITQIIVNREEENPTGRFGDVEASWQKFRQNFIAPDDICLGEDNNTSRSNTMHTHTKKNASIRTLRTVLIAAVITALLVGATYAAGVLGWLPMWTGEHFTFTSAEETSATEASDAGNCASLEEALSLHNAPGNIVPDYIPVGYEQVEFNYASTPGVYTTFDCGYSNGAGFIMLSYSIDYSDGYSLFTKDEGTPEVYTAFGIDHYIMTNEDEYKAIWQNGNFECSLSGFESREELIKAIDSMY